MIDQSRTVIQLVDQICYNFVMGQTRLLDIKWSLDLRHILVNVSLQRGNIYRLAHFSGHDERKGLSDKR